MPLRANGMGGLKAINSGAIAGFDWGYNRWCKLDADRMNPAKSKPKAPAAEPKMTIGLRLHIDGGAFNPVQAIVDLEAICRERLKHGHRLEVLDIFQLPPPALPAISRRRLGKSRKTPDAASTANRLLGVLTYAQYQRLRPALKEVTLRFEEVLHEPGVRHQYVYFPLDCLVSLQTRATGHHALEIGLVGHEGMVGIALVLGFSASPYRALVQRSGTALRMEADSFCREFLENERLQRALLQYKHALFGQIAQSIVCNQFHSIEERFVRYLLMTSDYARSKDIHLTHEFIASVLGVQRAGISNAAITLQKQKLIKCSRGTIRILDRKRLGAATCECYKVIKRIYDSTYLF